MEVAIRVMLGYFKENHEPPEAGRSVEGGFFRAFSGGQNPDFGLLPSTTVRKKISI